MNRSKSTTGPSPRATTTSGLNRTAGIVSGRRPIDKEVYLDAQSKGLTSRVVKYYQDSNASSRQSMYKSPGDLPIVHLKSNNILLKNRRSNSLLNLCVGRLDKNHANFDNRREILQRGLSTYDESYRPREAPVAPQMVHQMDPFISPRSVLDELKEISRKRIKKCDEPVDLKESKKYCREAAETDGPSGSGTAGSHQMANQKRQRDHISPPGVNLSPPQRTKKVCKDSYDVISSLSSSLGLARSKSSVPATTTTSSMAYGAKRPGSDLKSTRTGLDKLRFVGSSTSSAIPQPSLPASQNLPKISPPSAPQDLLRATASVPVMRIAKPGVPEPPKLTLFNKDYSTIPMPQRPVSENSDDEEEDSDYRSPFVKPQESSSPTLTAGKEEKRKVQQNKLALMLRSLAGDFGDSDEEEETVVKSSDTVDTPKPTTSSVSGATIAAPAPVSISLPLSTLPITKAATSIAVAPQPPTVEKPITVVAASPIKFNLEPQPVLAQPAAEENTANRVTSPPNSSSTVNISSTATTTATTAEKSGFNSPTAAMFTFNKTTTSPAVTSTAPVVIENKTASPGFKFGAAIPPLTGITPIVAASTSNSALATTAAPLATKSSIPGIFSFPKSPTASSTTSSITSAAISGISSLAQPVQPATGMFAFGGASNTTVATSTKPTEIKSPAPTSTFSFGGNSSILNNSVASSTSAATPPVFGFGNTPLKDPIPALLPANTAAAVQPTGTFSFGGNPSTTVANPTPVTSSQGGGSVPGMFSFGNAAKPAPAPVSQAAGTIPSSFGGFGAAGGSTTAGATASPFGGNVTSTVGNNPVVFGGAPKSAFGGGGSASSAIFGSQATSAAPNSGLGSATTTFSFGGAATGTASAGGAVQSPFGGGNSASPIFGAAAATPKPIPPPAYGTGTGGVERTGGFGGTVVNGTTSSSATGGSGVSSPFNFGGVGGGNNQVNVSSSSPFGGGGGGGGIGGSAMIRPIEPQKSSPFAFGGGGGGNNNPSPAFSFGGAGGGAGAGTTSSFGGNSQMNNPSMGGGGSAIGNKPVSGIATFGGTSNAATPFGDNKAGATFSFGNTSAGGGGGGSVGGGMGMPAVRPNQPGGAFNFSGAPANVTIGGGGGGAFKFGDSAATPVVNNNNPSGGGGGMFNFGGANSNTTQPQAVAPSSTFNFGGPSSGGGGAVAGNLFGGGAPATGPGAGGMFNFGAQGVPNGAGGGAPTFNIGSGGGGPPRRPIRQATRRLK